jgi:sirohydrochlorin ferrochelatase
MAAEGLSAMGLLLAAHGERNEGAVNHGILWLAATLRSLGVAGEVATGFIKGQPSVRDGVRALRCDDVLVYPLFLSAGYFTRVRLPQMLEGSLAAERHRRFRILAPLGLDPSLADVVARSLVARARRCAMAPKETSVILLAHGSGSDPASRLAAELVATKMQRRSLFRAVRVALLEEAPTLGEAVSALSPPILVFGLFAGEGLHGGADAPRLVSELGRGDVVFAGILANLPGIADLIAAAVVRAIASRECAARDAARLISCSAPALATATP